MGKVGQEMREQSSRPVSEVMQPIVTTVECEDHLAKIIYKMLTHDLNLLPVLKGEEVRRSKALCFRHSSPVVETALRRLRTGKGFDLLNLTIRHTIPVRIARFVAATKDIVDQVDDIIDVHIA